ncbi:hypothetical protein OIU78_029533 [Salix suchowensis]|nr:hypothetical protein OIU78_029533 [Salix suchowensis]
MAAMLIPRVRYAIRNRVSKLDLDFFIDESFHIVESKEDAIMISLFSLLEMIYMTDDMVLNLLKACPNIEKLKRLGLSSFYTAERELYLELDCPNLVWLGIDCVETGEFCIKNLSSLIEFRTSIAHKTEHYGHWFKVVKQLHRIAHIKHLVVQNWWRKLAAKDGIPKDFLLHNLKHLELQTRYTQYDLLGMAALLELCPNLETMILDPLYKIDDDESLSEELLNKPIHFRIPSLKEVKLKVIPEKIKIKLFNLWPSRKSKELSLDKIVLVPLYSGISLTKKASKSVSMVGCLCSAVALSPIGSPSLNIFAYSFS